MNIILWIIFGGLAGWIASIIVFTDANFGIIGNVVIGIVGAFLGGWIAEGIGANKEGGDERPTNIWSFVWAVVGAVVLLLLLNLVSNLLF